MEHIYLSHHGIKGQKWGVRRFQLKNGRLTAAGKKRYSEDEEEQKKKAEEESAPKKKSVSEMSDQELREAINRAQLEESYRRYYEPAKQQPEIGLGEKFVQASKDVLKKQVVDPTLSSFSRSISTAVDKKISEKFGTKPKTINDLLKTDVRKLSPDELQKVVNYNNNLKTYREQQKYNSVDSEVDRMQKERNDRRKSQIDMEQQELNLRMKRATVEKMEEERRKARETVMDVVKDVASQTVNEYRSPSEERAKAVVDKYFDEPLMLPKPDDDVKHSDILEHHGIKGQKWGVRRFQNADGTLTPMGKRRYDDYFDDDGNLTRQGKINIRSVDGVTANNFSKGLVGHGVIYVSDYVKEYGDIPINRIRFDAGASTSTYGNRADGQSYDFDWHDTKMSDITDAYDEYRKSLEWD